MLPSHAHSTWEEGTRGEGAIAFLSPQEGRHHETQISEPGSLRPWVLFSSDHFEPGATNLTTISLAWQRAW